MNANREQQRGLVETLSSAVHGAWMRTKVSQGIVSRRSESGEELMVPYVDLSEAAKDLDRGSVRAVLDAIRTSRAVVVTAADLAQLLDELHTPKTSVGPYNAVEEFFKDRGLEVRP